MPRPPEHDKRAWKGAVTRREAVKTATAASVFALLAPSFGSAQQREDGAMSKVILRNGRITTLDRAKPEVHAIAIRDGLVEAIGANEEIMRLADGGTNVINLDGRRVIPGLNDSHTHLIRGGLNYNMELRWENVSSLADALRIGIDEVLITIRGDGTNKTIAICRFDGPGVFFDSTPVLP